MKDIISQELDMEASAPLEIEIPDVKKIVENNNEYEYARENIYRTIEMGTTALAEMMALAKVSESARAYEVVSTLVKTVLDANKDLVELSNKQKELEKKHGENQEKKSENSLFIGSTTELKKMLEKI